MWRRRRGGNGRWCCLCPRRAAAAAVSLHRLLSASFGTPEQRWFGVPRPLTPARAAGPLRLAAPRRDGHPNSGSAASSRTRGVMLRGAEGEGESRGRGCRGRHLMLWLLPHPHLSSWVRGTLLALPHQPDRREAGPRAGGSRPSAVRGHSDLKRLALSPEPRQSRQERNG